MRGRTSESWSERAEQQLRGPGDPDWSLVDHLPLVTYVGSVDGHSRSTYVSPQIEELVGYTQDEWRSDPELFVKLLHPHDRERVLSEIGRASETHEPLSCEYRLLARDGSVVWVEEKSVTVRDEDGHALYVQGYMRDITNRKRGEQRLRESEERLRAIFEHAGVGIVIAGPDRRVMASNRAVEELLGYTREELQGMSSDELTHPDDRAASLAHFEQVAAGSATRLRLEKRYMRKDGSIAWTEVSAARVDDAAGGFHFLVVMMQDISERKRLEEQFRQAQKMESVGRLAGGIAHDFNNLLLAIRGYSELALSRLDEAGRDGELRDDIRQIKQATDRAASLTRQLLAFSRKQILQPSVVELDRLIAEMESLLRRLTGADIELELELADANARVRIDRSQLEQAIMNIAINARDAMPEGGRLTIATERADLEEPYVREGATLQPDRYAVVRISDTGCGMDAETKRHAFEPFFTTKDEGTGLGLSTAYGFVKQSDGFIFVESQPGRGTTFTIYLPCVGDPLAELPTEELPVVQTSGTETILLAEDEDLVRGLLRDVLEKEGYVVLEAKNGLDALRLAERHEGPIHALVTDLVMPVMGGREAAERFAKLRPGTKVVYISGYTEERRVLDELEDAAAFVQKPFAPGVLAAKVREVLDGGVGAAKA